MAELKINRKDLPVGSVGYFVERSNNPPYEYQVHFGIVKVHYPGEIALQLYELVDVRLINGTPIKEFETPTRWMKLPKGWTYSTKLYDLSFGEFNHDPSDYNLEKPEDILKAIDNGILVKVQDNDHARIETEIDKKDGFRIVRNYPPYDFYRTYVTVRFDKVYATYEEAKKELDAINAEFERQSELSDYDWSLEQIDKDINKCVAMAYITEKQGKEYRQRLIDMGKVEDIETRVFNGGLQWKYWKKKKWQTLV